MILSMKNAWRTWTGEEDRQLREMVEAKKSVTIMALRLKRTEVAIRNRLSVLKLSMRN